jgi:hypothetical protein
VGLGPGPIRAASAVAARSTRPPTIMQVRLATVGPLSGTSSVDGIGTWTSVAATPSASAASCVKIVIAPWPMSVELARTAKPPSARAATVARPARRCSPEPVKPAPWK